MHLRDLGWYSIAGHHIRVSAPAGLKLSCALLTPAGEQVFALAPEVKDRSHAEELVELLRAAGASGVIGDRKSAGP